MNVTPENIIVNSCEYTPVYLIPSTSVTQSGSYIIAPSNQDVQKPIADNLKSYYENSGNLEGSLLSSPKPRILKKHNTIGNNLKLASFLLPKTESVNIQTKQCIAPVAPVTPVTNVIVKPVVTAIPLPVVPVTTVPTPIPQTPLPQQPHNVNGDKTKKIPAMELDRKIVRVGTIPNTTRSHPRSLPKIIKEIKPKEKIEPTPAKHTSVQLLKLGETYHSLSQLSDEQMKIVNKALKIFSDPEKIPKEPAYDPVTNTNFIYKVVSPRDLTIVGRNKVVVKKKAEVKKHKISKTTEDSPKQKISKLTESPPKQKTSKTKEDSPKPEKKLVDAANQKVSKLTGDVPKQKVSKSTDVSKQKVSKLTEDVPKQKVSKLTGDVPKQKVSKFSDETPKQRLSKLLEEYPKQRMMKATEDAFEENFIEPEEVLLQPKVTRSGRKVKLPKQMRPVEANAPQKPRKKHGSVVNCFQCSAEFCSFYRLQRHYENYPTHIPARIHSNLFHCLLAIIKGGGEGDQANIFIQQLEQLIEKLRTLLPCLLIKMNGKEGQPCTVNDNIGRLLGMDPGKYHLNIDALNCVKNKEGHCIHNPAPKASPVNTDPNTAQLRVNDPKEETTNEIETEDCARINSVDKWPTVTKRIWKLKQQKEKLNAKKMRLTSESEPLIELGIEDVELFCKKENSAIISSNEPTESEPPHEQMMAESETDQMILPLESQMRSANNTRIQQFHSAHFDIRSSPIKLPSSLVRKFQLHPDKVADLLQVQILKPLELEPDNDNTINSETQCDNALQEIFKNNTEPPKETDIESELNFTSAKGWPIEASSELSNDSFMKSNILFETGLTPVKSDSVIQPSLIHVTDKSDCLFDPETSKANELTEANLLEIISKSNNLIETSLLHGNEKSNDLFGPTHELLHGKEDCNGFYEPSLHVETKCNSLIGSSATQLKCKAFDTALSHVKERSNHLFDTELLLSRSKSDSSLEQLLHNKQDINIFGSSLSQNKERPNALFSQSVTVSKDSLLTPTLLLKDDSNGLFDPSLSDGKSNGSMGQSLVEHKSNGLFDNSLLHTKDLSTPVSIDINQTDAVDSDSRLLSNQGQSVLSFLDSLANESLELSYSETEIRNNTVDFQLDLFSFNNSS